MGVTIEMAEIIIREHGFRKLEGSVLLTGRQTMFFSPEDALRLFHDLGVEPVPIPLEQLRIDGQTRQSTEARYLLDYDFFRLIGITDIRSIDHSDYEGAEIVHDLNLPVPGSLEGTADIIIDGSTLDNVFNPAQCMINFTRLLRPGGRLISINMGTNHNVPYMMPTPMWLFDYFVYNRFNDAKLYFISFTHTGRNVLTIDYGKLHEGVQGVHNPNPGQMSHIIVVAERGDATVSDVRPSQHHYRSRESWREFTSRLEPFLDSTRGVHIRSNTDRVVDVPEGYLYLAAANASL